MGAALKYYLVRYKHLGYKVCYLEMCQSCMVAHVPPNRDGEDSNLNLQLSLIGHCHSVAFEVLELLSIVISEEA